MVQTESQNTSIGLSPVMLYHLNTTNRHTNVCEQDICTYEYKLHWHGDEMCQLTLICSHMGPHICADHGLTMETNNTELLNICHPDQIYQTNVSRISTVLAKFWYAPNAILDMSCYIWCDDLNHQYQLVYPVNNSTWPPTFMGKVPIQWEPHGSPMSGQFVYNIEITNDSIEQCDQDLCYKSSILKWYSPYPCQAILHCNSLSGNICGDFGIKMTIKNHTVNICQPNQYYQGSLFSMDTAKIQFWYTEDTGSYNISCKLWCDHPKTFVMSQNSSSTIPAGMIFRLSINSYWFRLS